MATADIAWEAAAGSNTAMGAAFDRCGKAGKYWQIAVGTPGLAVNSGVKPPSDSTVLKTV